MLLTSDFPKGGLLPPHPLKGEWLVFLIKRKGTRLGNIKEKI